MPLPSTIAYSTNLPLALAVANLLHWLKGSHPALAVARHRGRRALVGLFVIWSVDLLAAVVVARLFDAALSEDVFRLLVTSATLVSRALVFARHRPSPARRSIAADPRP